MESSFHSVGEWITANLALSLVLLVAFGAAFALIAYAIYRATRARGEHLIE